MRAPATLRGVRMAKRQARRYFDSAVITRLVENRDPELTIQTLVQEAASGNWTLVLSTVSMLEVTRETGKPVDPLKYARILEFFENEYIFVRELDVLLAEQALKLIYNYLWLRPNDAAHLAAAIDMKCQIFYTYDEELISKFDNEHGLRVVRPGTAVNVTDRIDAGVEELPLFKQPDPTERG